MIDLWNEFLSTYQEWHYFGVGFSFGFVVSTVLHHHVLPVLRDYYGD